MCAAVIRLVAILGALILFPLSPEQHGFDAALLCAMGKGVVDGKLANVDSIVIVRHGVLVYERYFAYPHQLDFDATTKHAGNSMTKSVVSRLVGMAMDRGLIKDLDAPVFSYFPEYTDLRTPEKDRITLRGQFVLNHGVWEGKQIVPASWVAQSTAEQIKAREPFSYGYQWWLGRWR